MHHDRLLAAPQPHLLYLAAALRGQAVWELDLRRDVGLLFAAGGLPGQPARLRRRSPPRPKARLVEHRAARATARPGPSWRPLLYLLSTVSREARRSELTRRRARALGRRRSSGSARSARRRRRSRRGAGRCTWRCCCSACSRGLRTCDGTGACDSRGWGTRRGTSCRAAPSSFWCSAMSGQRRPSAPCSTATVTSTTPSSSTQVNNIQKENSATGSRRGFVVRYHR